MSGKQDRFDHEGHINDINIALISDMISGGREDRIPEDIMLHCGECILCRDRALDIFCSTQTPNTPAIPLPRLFVIPEKKKGLPFTGPFLRSAAAFFIIAFALAVYLMIDSEGGIKGISNDLKPEKSSVKISSAQPEARKDKGKKDLRKSVPAEKKVTGKKEKYDPFRDNPNLEYMVDSPQRGRTIHVISPEFRIPEKGRIIFSWENHLDKDLHLKILNNRNETLFVLKAMNSRAEFSGEISPGLYYWKLEDNENLYHVGKFIVEK